MKSIDTSQDTSGCRGPLEAGGKRSTWFPPGKFVELSDFSQKVTKWVNNQHFEVRSLMTFIDATFARLWGQKMPNEVRSLHNYPSIFWTENVVQTQPLRARFSQQAQSF